MPGVTKRFLISVIDFTSSSGTGVVPVRSKPRKSRIATGSAWADPYFYDDFTFTFTVPGDMPAGDYFVGATPDPDNDVSEEPEGNNRVPFPGKIEVTR
jgi:hypothetical protein